MIRYEIYNIMNKYGGTSADPETQKAQVAEIDEIFNKKPEFQM